MISTVRKTATATAAAAALGGAMFLAPMGAQADGNGNGNRPVDIEVFAPEQGADAGVSGTGWFVDMEVDFNQTPLADTGFDGLRPDRPVTTTSRRRPASSGPDATTRCLASWS